MSSHFRWYDAKSDIVVPYNASYDFPTQANQTTKTLPRINPSGRNSFAPGDVMRIELPAVGYCNLSKSTLSFDVILEYTPAAADDASIVRFQNDINCIFQRFRHLYGSSPFEDIQDYGRLSRCFTEWTASCHFDQSSISAGIGNSLMGCGGFEAGSYTAAVIGDTFSTPAIRYRNNFNQFPVSARQRTHGIGLQQAFNSKTDPSKISNTASFCEGFGFGATPCFENTKISNAPGATSGTGIFLQAAGDNAPQLIDPAYLAGGSPGFIQVRRRYCIPLNSGLATQAKLFPLKWMASQNILEFTMAQAAECIMFHQGYRAGAVTGDWNSVGKPNNVKYRIEDVVFQPEILEFDSSYDEEFLKGLSGDGIPILFSTFNTFYSNTQPSTKQVLVIPERSRSVKSLFTVMSRATPSIRTDSGATFYTSALNVLGVGSGQSVGSTLQSFQYQLGSRYYPAAPVVCSTVVGGNNSNGGSEAFIELSKALNTLGDYRLSIDANALTFATCPLVVDQNASAGTGFGTYISDFQKPWFGSVYAILNEYDGRFMIVNRSDSLYGSAHTAIECEAPRSADTTVAMDKEDWSGRVGFGTGSSCFAASINLETSSGIEISGLNGEIATSLTLYLNYSAQQDTNMTYITWSYVDVMLILQANNVVTLIK